MAIEQHPSCLAIGENDEECAKPDSGSGGFYYMGREVLGSRLTVDSLERQS